MFRSLLIVCSLFALTASLHAQTTGTLTGRVLTEEAGTPLAGATVEVLITDSARSTSTDANGRFTMEGLPTGIFAVRASLPGHGAVLVPEVWMRAGKEEQVELRLEAEAKDLKEAEVITVRRTEALGTRPITVEQSLRYPAMFFDPARVAGSMAGVGGMNDQANHLTIRGNSPNANA